MKDFLRTFVGCDPREDDREYEQDPRWARIVVYLLLVGAAGVMLAAWLSREWIRSL